MSFTLEDYTIRKMTLKEGEVIIPITISIKTTQPIIYASDAQMVSKSIEVIPSTALKVGLEVIDLLDDGVTLRYKFLQKFMEASSNRRGDVFYDRKLKDIIIIPNIEEVNLVSWRQKKNDILCGYRVGSGKDLSYTLNKTELSLGIVVNEIVEIPEPAAFLGKSHLIDAYGLQPGDSGNHYNNSLYYESQRERNGISVTFGVQRYQTDTTNMIELGTIADLYPDGLLTGIPIYGITQPDLSFYSAELMGLRVKPNPTDKLYILMDV